MGFLRLAVKKQCMHYPYRKHVLQVLLNLITTTKQMKKS